MGKRIFLAIGVLVAVFAASCANTHQSSRPSQDQLEFERVQNDVLVVLRALEKYCADTGGYPTTDQGLRALVSEPQGLSVKWNGPYIGTLPKVSLRDDFQYSLQSMMYWDPQKQTWVSSGSFGCKIKVRTTGGMHSWVIGPCRAPPGGTWMSPRK